MEEETLLRERLQAITDKRRIREEIEKKRRNAEEEKFKLQYLKKKTLREQWLMDGLNTLSKEEQESAKAQTEDIQHQAELLQSNIDRIEVEIGDLETQELEISAKEEIILKQLKEVEKTTEDIIKEVHANTHSDPVQYVYTAIPDVPKSYTPTIKRRYFTPTKFEADGEQEKQATYTMKISVEKDLRTGESHILSTATVEPQDLHQRGIKVYEDGRKSIYAMPQDGRVSQNEVNLSMSSLEVEELLMKASEKKTPADVEYHDPVFSSPFSRPTTPQIIERGYVSFFGLHTSTKTQSPFQALNSTSEETGSLDGNQSPAFKTDISSIADCFDGEYRSISPTSTYIPDYEEEESPVTPTGDSGLGLARCSPINPRDDDSRVNFVRCLPPEVECGEPVTMIFMGYQNAESDEEDEGIQAELVVIGGDDEEDCVHGKDPDTEDAHLSYHPQGYHSKIFKPNNMYRSEIRPGGIRTYNFGGRDFGNELGSPVATGIIRG